MADDLYTNKLFPMEPKPPKPPPPKRQRVAVQISEEAMSDLKFVAGVWNEMNKVLKRKGRGWAAMSVAKRMMLVSLERFLRTYGGRPSWNENNPNPALREEKMTIEERAALTERALADVKARSTGQ